MCNAWTWVGGSSGNVGTHLIVIFPDKLIDLIRQAVEVGEV
jgi:hypothetical protein